MKRIEYVPGERLVSLDRGRVVDVRVRTDGDDTVVGRTVDGVADPDVFRGSRSQAEAVVAALADEGGPEAPVSAAVPVAPRGRIAGAAVALGAGVAGVLATLAVFSLVDRPSQGAPVVVATPEPLLPPAPFEGRPLSRNGASGENLLPPSSRDTAPTVPLPRIGQTPSGPVADAKATADGLAARAQQARVEADRTTAQARASVEADGTDAAKAQLDQLQDVMRKLTSGEKLAPEVVRQLPHEIAQKLTEAGAVATPEEMAVASKGTSRPFAIVKLPEAILDANRDKDGIPTVPEANSWAATGGNVVIPLPGGGEVKTADDLRTAFKLQM